MPYYIYQITEQPIRQLKKLASHPSFREATADAKHLRAAGSEGTVKVIFADNELQAEDLLMQVREAPPMIGDDY